MSGDIEDFLGGGGRSLSFNKLPAGTSFRGVITDQPTMEQQTDYDTNEPLFWDPPYNRKPKMQMIIPLELVAEDRDGEDDDGQRRWYVKGYAQNALRDAMREAQARRPEVGGKLEITFTHEGEPKSRKHNPPKFYKVTYWPPSGVEDFLDEVEAANISAPHSNGQAAPKRRREEYARPPGGRIQREPREIPDEPPF